MRRVSKASQAVVNMRTALARGASWPAATHDGLRHLRPRVSMPTYIRQHERSHKDERNFFCRYCHRSFTQKGDLLRHRNNVHRRLVFRCNHCNTVRTRKPPQCPSTSAPNTISPPPTSRPLHRPRTRPRHRRPRNYSKSPLSTPSHAFRRHSRFSQRRQRRRSHLRLLVFVFIQHHFFALPRTRHVQRRPALFLDFI